ncbi:ferritin-like domain-containing protein [Streptomyces sp. NPDC046203]|uniref:ferritin-like domain-containing protein n=1 Tax=Streptomyces sp. NPDC046203 TaxID=3154602 RepID=UPI00340EE52A
MLKKRLTRTTRPTHEDHVDHEDYADWVAAFHAERRRRDTLGDPLWGQGSRLPAALVRSIQRFQVGEDGDGAQLLAKARRAGIPGYGEAAALFIAEERDHARMLAAAGAGTLDGHWTDAAFVRLRRTLGLRTEVLVLMVAEVVALRYYRALRDGTDDPLVTEVAGRILADEERHVPFHCRRLRADLGGGPRPVRRGTTAVWRGLVAGAALVVAYDHGPALRALGVSRTAFFRDVVGSSAPMAAMMDGRLPVPDRMPDRSVTFTAPGPGGGQLGYS